jgi:hypothetical protein
MLHAGVHAGERGAHGVLATILGREGGPTQHKTEIQERTRTVTDAMRSDVAGGGVDAESRAQWCAVRFAPRPLSDGL